MVVEITPIGIKTLSWKFYIIWTVLNGSFVPFTYFLYPETAGRTRKSTRWHSSSEGGNRLTNITVEDIDSYFRDQPSLLVFRDKVSLRLIPLSFTK